MHIYFSKEEVYIYILHCVYDRVLYTIYMHALFVNSLFLIESSSSSPAHTSQQHASMHFFYKNNPSDHQTIETQKVIIRLLNPLL